MKYWMGFWGFGVLGFWGRSGRGRKKSEKNSVTKEKWS